MRVRRVLSLIGKVWNLPNTLIGLTYGSVGLALALLLRSRTQQRPYIDCAYNAIQFHQIPPPLMLPGSGLTLGNVVLYGIWPAEERLSLASLIGEHEQAHTWQGEVLGPLYLPFHITSIIAGMTLDGSMHGPHAWGETGPMNIPPRAFKWPGKRHTG